MGLTESICELAGPIVAAAGLELWDVEVAAGLLRVLVDRPDGVDLDALAEASRRLSALLDSHDELVPAGRYDLEVSSPGIERTLRTPEQYRRYVGAQVALKLARALQGSRRLNGTLVEATSGGIAVALEGSAGEAARIAYSDIQRAHLVASWGTPPRPGGGTAGAGHTRNTNRARSRAGATRTPAVAAARPVPGSAPQPKDA